MTVAIFSFFDANGNPIVSIPSTDALSASEFIPDTTPPILLSFDLNLTSEALILTFDEVMNTSSLKPSGIVIQSSPFSLSGVTLAGSFTSSINSPVVVVHVEVSSLNRIKSNLVLATSINTTFLTIGPHTISDVSGNSVIPIQNGFALQVQIFTADIVSIELLSFSLDLDIDLIELQFSEPMDADASNATCRNYHLLCCNLFNRNQPDQWKHRCSRLQQQYPGAGFLQL